MSEPLRAVFTARDTADAFRILLLLIGVLLVVSPLQSGPIHPPLQALRNGHYTLVSGTVSGYSQAERTLSLVDVEPIRAAASVADAIDIEFPAFAAADLVDGKRYLFVYTDVRRDSLQAKRFVRGERKFIVHTDGADPAFLADTPANRALLDDAHREVEKGSDYAALVREGLGSDDPALVDLWLAEFVHRPGTFAAPTAADQREFRRIVSDSKQKPAARARILLASIDRGDDWSGGWSGQAAFGILGEFQPQQLIDQPQRRQLIYAALVVAQRLPDAEHRDTLARWLAADDAIAELAADALAAISPQAEKEGLQQALAMESTSAATERMIRRRLARYTR